LIVDLVACDAVTSENTVWRGWWWHHSPLPKHTALHPRRFQSSATVVGEPQILQVFSSWTNWEVPYILWSQSFVSVFM